MIIDNMKTVKYTFLALAAAAMVTSCGVSNRHDEVKELVETAKEDHEWNADETNRAIDIYLEGLKEDADMYENTFLLQEKSLLDYHLEQKGKRSVIKDRKQELKDARESYKEKVKELTDKYSDD